MKNEAELTAKISEVLTKVFPTFEDVKLTHQKSFSIKFGHHNVQIDYEDPSNYASRAIYDILLKVGDVNCILLELKREGLKLTDEDIEQGLSYARLVHPMPPVTLISNGKENLFYNTFTKEKIDVKTIDFNQITELIKNSFELATNDLKDAVKLLLNKDPKLFASVINEISEEKFNRISGDLGDFSFPVCKEFVIEREIVKEAYELFSKGEILVGIMGPAFSGKTNVLYQFFDKYSKEPKHFILYIDASDHNYSILQQLANSMSITFKTSIDTNKIREWLITALHFDATSKFFLLVDNFNNDIPFAIKSEVIELIDLFKGTNHGILFTVDELSYNKLAFIEQRRYKTVIGSSSKILKLDELTDVEYKAANDKLYKEFKVSIENGGHMTPEYREPRTLRHLALLYNAKDEATGKYTPIMAVPDVNLLKAFSKNALYSRHTHNLYKKLAICFHNDSKLRSQSPELHIAASGSGAITLSSFKKQFPDHVDELLSSSMVVLRELKDDVTIIYPKLPELIAFYSIEIIKQAILKFPERKPVKSLAKYFTDILTPLPFCDVVGAAVLLEIGYLQKVELFSKLTQELLRTPPRIEKVKPGTKTLMYIEGVGNVNMDFIDGDEESSFVTDFLPYTILSQLAHFPLKIQNNGYSEYAFHLQLLYELGSSPHTIRRADARSLKNMKPIHTHAFEGIGETVDGTEGIIEPIVQAIQKCFFEIPDEIEKLYKRAIEDNNMMLVWRIYLAIRALVNIDNEDLSKRAKTFIKAFEIYFNKFMPEYLSKHIEDLEERKKFIEEFPWYKVD